MCTKHYDIIMTSRRWLLYSHGLSGTVREIPSPVRVVFLYIHVQKLVPFIHLLSPPTCGVQHYTTQGHVRRAPEKRYTIKKRPGKSPDVSAVGQLSEERAVLANLF